MQEPTPLYSYVITTMLHVDCLLMKVTGIPWITPEELAFSEDLFLDCIIYHSLFFRSFGMDCGINKLPMAEHMEMVHFLSF